MDKDKNKNGNFLHKLFKFVILFIVAIFIYLIISFIRLEFFKSTGIDYKFNMKSEKYDILDKVDQEFFYLDDGNIEDCEEDSFYTSHVINHQPCVFINGDVDTQEYLSKAKKYIKDEINLNSAKLNIRGAEHKIGMMDFCKYLDFMDLFVESNDQNFEKKTEDSLLDKNEGSPLIDKDLVISVIEGSVEVAVSPITQINRLNPYKKNNIAEDDYKQAMLFEPIYIKDNLFDAHNKVDEDNKKRVWDSKNKLIVMSKVLNEGDVLYLPAFFFKQFRIVKKEKKVNSDGGSIGNIGSNPNGNGGSNSNSKSESNKTILLNYEFQSSSRMLRTINKVLFDDTSKTFGLGRTEYH